MSSYFFIVTFAPVTQTAWLFNVVHFSTSILAPIANIVSECDMLTYCKNIIFGFEDPCSHNFRQLVLPSLRRNGRTLFDLSRFHHQIWRANSLPLRLFVCSFCHPCL